MPAMMIGEPNGAGWEDIFVRSNSAREAKFYRPRRLRRAQMRRASVQNTVPNDAPQRLYAVFPADFLSLVIGSARVRDRHFVDAHAEPCHLRRHFRLEAEPILFECDGLENLA